jgi:hypothetical protein
MSDGANGTNCLLYRFDGSADAVIVGQMEITSAFNGAPIDISNKSYGDFVTLMDAQLSTKGRTMAATIIYSNDAEYKQLRADTLAGTIREYMLDYGTGLVADQIRFNGIPNAPSDSAPVGDKVTTSLSILSVGDDI